MIKIVMLVITVLLTAVVLIIGFLPYYDSDDAYCCLYLAIVVNTILNVLILGVVLNGLA